MIKTQTTLHFFLNTGRRPYQPAFTHPVVQAEYSFWRGCKQDFYERKAKRQISMIT